MAHESGTTSPVTLAAPALRPKQLGLWARYQRRVAPYLFIAPFYLLFILFFVGPALFAFVLSFAAWDGVNAIRWLGLTNYRELLADPTFRTAIVNTVWYIIASLLVVCPLALMLAVALNADSLRGKAFFRTVYFMPIITSTVLIAIMFALIYDRDYGLLDAGFQLLGIPQIDFLGSPRWSKVAITGLLIWRWTGFTMIYFLAGLQSIPRELLEAAWVDGADRWQSFFHITLPLLRPVVAFVAVIVLIGSSQIFEEPFILTHGGPSDSSLSIVEYLYRVGFQFLRLGYASTIGVALFSVIFAFSLLQIRLLGVFSED